MIVALHRPLVALLLLAFSWNAWLRWLPASAETESHNSANFDRSNASALKIEQIVQEDLLCVPTSASMIMAFYGDPQSPRKLKTMSRGKSYVASAPFNDFSMTFYRDVVKAAAALGYDWYERVLEDPELGLQQGLSIIRNEIGHRRPVMIDVSAPEGHTVVVAGFDEAAQSIIVVDPNAPAPGRYAISFERLRSIWNEHAFNGRFRSLVTTSPRRHAP